MKVLTSAIANILVCPDLIGSSDIRGLLEEAGHWDKSLYLSCPQSFSPTSPSLLPSSVFCICWEVGIPSLTYPSVMILYFLMAPRAVEPALKWNPEIELNLSSLNWFPQVYLGKWGKVDSWSLTSEKNWGKGEDPLKVMIDCCWKIDLENTGA